MTIDTLIKTSPFLRIVPHESGHAVYHSLRGNLCLVDNDVLSLLEAFKTSHTTAMAAEETGQPIEFIQEFIQTFHSRKFLVSPGEDERNVIDMAVAERRGRLQKGGIVTLLQLVTTNCCNFRCRYCFTERIYCSEKRQSLRDDHNNQVMSIETACAAVTLLCDRAKTAGHHRVGIQFFGGEPLVNWKTIKYVLDTYGDGADRGLHISYSIVTNGSLITDEIAQVLKTRDVAVIVSFDSPEGDDRILANGDRSRPLVEQGLGILSKHENRVVFNSVLCEETYRYFGTDVADFALLYGVREIGVLFDLNPSFYVNHQPADIVDRVWTLYQYAKSRGILVTGYWHQIFQQILQGGMLAGRNFKTCSATGAQLSVEPSGHAFSCKGSSGYFGHISRPDELFSSPGYEKYAMHAFYNSPSCAGCEIELFCGGLCLGSREKRFGRLDAIEPQACAVYRELTRRLIGDLHEDQVDVYQSSLTEAGA